MIDEEIKEQTDKLKEMDLKHKISYIWDYYKLPIIIAIIFIFSVSSFIYNRVTAKQTVFYVAMLNANTSSVSENNLLTGFADTIEGFDADHEQIRIDADYKIQGTDQMAYAYMQKILTEYNVGTIDASIGPKEVIEQFAASQAFTDLNKLLPVSLYDALNKAGWEFLYCTYEDPATGKVYEYPAAVNISSSPAITEGFNDIEGKHYPYFNTDCYYAISSNASHTDTAIAFLEYLLSHKL
ncbi:MAG: hypothetical protein K6G03_03100 [Lachnospiraceae bacterium]|nr:hypothetical protein [Lachnospiraceae bacterium]